MTKELHLRDGGGSEQHRTVYYIGTGVKMWVPGVGKVIAVAEDADAASKLFRMIHDMDADPDKFEEVAVSKNNGADA